MDPLVKHFNANYIENLNADVVFCLTFVNDLPLPNLAGFFNPLVQVRGCQPENLGRGAGGGGEHCGAVLTDCAQASAGGAGGRCRRSRCAARRTLKST